MLDISFEIPGPVVGKGRPRFVRQTGRTYTPEATLTYENLIRATAAEKMRGAAPTERPVDMVLRVLTPVTAGWPEWKRAAALAGTVKPTGKPDADNVLKLVSDALNGIVFKDDAQVVTATLEKAYGAVPGLSVHIRMLAAHPASISRKSDLEG